VGDFIWYKWNEGKLTHLVLIRYQFKKSSNRLLLLFHVVLFDCSLLCLGWISYRLRDEFAFVSLELVGELEGSENFLI